MQSKDAYQKHPPNSEKHVEEDHVWHKRKMMNKSPPIASLPSLHSIVCSFNSCRTALINFPSSDYGTHERNQINTAVCIWRGEWDRGWTCGPWGERGEGWDQCSPTSNYALLMQYSIFYTYRLNQPTTSAQTQSVIFTTNQPFLNMEMHLRIQPEIWSYTENYIWHQLLSWLTLFLTHWPLIERRWGIRTTSSNLVSCS